MTMPAIEPDFGERLGADGLLLDEYCAARSAVPIADEHIAALLALELCRARIGERPDWAKALKAYSKQGEPN
jgi:hypothetical protein